MNRIFALFFAAMMACASFAQTISVIGLDGNVIAEYGADQIDQFFFNCDESLYNLYGGDALGSEIIIDVLIVQVDNGESMRIALKQQPRVTLLENRLILATNHETITLDGTKPINFTFDTASSLVELMALAEPTFYFDNSVLRVSGLDGFEPISIYSVDGQCIYSGNADNDGYAELDITSYQGVFVVQTNARSIKFPLRNR